MDELKKVKEGLSETLELLKTEKGDEALAKLESVIDGISATEEALQKTESEMTKTKEENETALQKMAKMEEEMKKWADMYVSAANLTELLKDLKEGVTGEMKKMQEAFEKTIAELPQGSKQVTKTTGGEPEAGMWDSVIPGN